MDGEKGDEKDSSEIKEMPSNDQHLHHKRHADKAHLLFVKDTPRVGDTAII